MAGTVSREQSHSHCHLPTLALREGEGLERAAEARELMVGGDPSKKESQPRIQSKIYLHDETANQL